MTRRLWTMWPNSNILLDDCINALQQPCRKLLDSVLMTMTSRMMGIEKFPLPWTMESRQMKHVERRSLHCIHYRKWYDSLLCSFQLRGWDAPGELPKVFLLPFQKPDSWPSYITLSLYKVWGFSLRRLLSPIPRLLARIYRSTSQICLIHFLPYHVLPSTQLVFSFLMRSPFVKSPILCMTCLLVGTLSIYFTTVDSMLISTAINSP